MNIEGMWAAYFGDVGGEQLNSGVVVLETERLFGGDSMIAYLGSYTASGASVTATFDTWAYNPTIVVQTAFGDVGPDREPAPCRALWMRPTSQSLARSGATQTRL